METQTQQQPQHIPANAPPEQTNHTSLLGRVVEETLGRDQQRLAFERDRFEFQQRRAKLYAKSGLFSGQKDLTEEQAIAQAMVRIELGASMGFSEAESLQGIRVINGETSIASALRASRMQAAGYTWVVEWIGSEEDCKGCRIWPSFKGKPIVDRKGNEVSVAFTEDDAKKMLTTIWDNGQKKRVPILEKDNWKMSKRNMYFARAITNTQRFYAPGVLTVNLPSAEEMLDADQTSPQDAISSTRPPDDDPRWYSTGSAKFAQEVAELKIQKMREQGMAPASPSGGPTTTETTAETAPQPADQTATAEQQGGRVAGMPLQPPSQMPEFESWEDMRQAMGTNEPEWVMVAGSIRHMGETGYQKWEPPTPPTTRPKFGRKGQ